MNHRLRPSLLLPPRLTALLLTLTLWNGAWLGRAWAASSSTNQPFPGVSCYSETQQEPSNRLFIAELDLTQPTLRLRVAPGGADPDGPGHWQTTLMRPTAVAAREHFDLVINGDFFDVPHLKGAQATNAPLHSETWASVLGHAVSDGRVWSSASNALPCLVAHKNGKVSIQTLQRPTPEDWEVIAGNTLLLDKGQVVPHKSKTRHPRTAVGLNAAGTRLVLLVVEGRRPGVSVGMSYDELAAEMLRHGCFEALNLDGGGSSVMALRERATGTYRILNSPTDGHERAVANVLGVCVGSGPAAPSQSPLKREK